MAQAVGTPQQPGPLLRELYAPIHKPMQSVERLLAEQMTSDDPLVDELVKHGFRLGGKRLRPALVLLAGQSAGELVDDHIVLGAVVEMIHTATLVHDDVLDEADIRRHQKTVNARYNNEASVLLGDFLFTHAFYLASTLDSTFACRTIGRSTNIVCDGELRQLHSAGNFELKQADYLRIIDAKTAELCACCCRLGAFYAGADERQVQRLGEYGRALGIAFQIVDDLLDLTGDEHQTGKSLGSDAAKQKPTLPLIHFLATAQPADRRAALQTLQQPGTGSRPQLIELLFRSGSFQYAQDCARRYADTAWQQISALPENPATAVLRNLTRFVIQRQM